MEISILSVNFQLLVMLVSAKNVDMGRALIIKSIAQGIDSRTVSRLCREVVQVSVELKNFYLFTTNLGYFNETGCRVET